VRGLSARTVEPGPGWHAHARPRLHCNMELKRPQNQAVRVKAATPQGGPYRRRSRR